MYNVHVIHKLFSSTWILFHISGVYCILLVADDRAGNHQIVRRFLIFDDVNVVQTSPHESEKLWVPTAADNTSNTWITDLHSDVIIKGDAQD